MTQIIIKLYNNDKSYYAWKSATSVQFGQFGAFINKREEEMFTEMNIPKDPNV